MTKDNLFVLKGEKNGTQIIGDFEIKIRLRGNDLSWDVDNKVSGLVAIGALEWAKGKVMDGCFEYVEMPGDN